MFRKKIVQFVDSAESNLKTSRKISDLTRFLKSKAIKWIPIFILFFSSSNLFWKIIFPFLYWLVTTIFVDYQFIFTFKPKINVWFGIPGSGKTTMAAMLTKYSKSCYNVLSNVPIRGAYKLDNDDLGYYDMSFDGAGAHVIIDEAVDGFDSRNFKDFAKTTKPKYFATHRHQNNRVDVFSQAYDIDKRIRDRAGSSNLYHLSRSLFPGWVKVRFISKILFIKKDDHQMIDGFKYRGLPRIIRCKSVWDSFDTIDKTLIPKNKKEWVRWYE